MVRVCEKCDYRDPDTMSESECPDCGVQAWVVVDAPEKDLKFTKQDREFLKVNRIAPE